MWQSKEAIFEKNSTFKIFFYIFKGIIINILRIQSTIFEELSFTTWRCFKKSWILAKFLIVLDCQNSIFDQIKKTGGSLYEELYAKNAESWIVIGSFVKYCSKPLQIWKLIELYEQSENLKNWFFFHFTPGHEVISQEAKWEINTEIIWISVDKFSVLSIKPLVS